ncbi:MAG: fibronectin type III domain-containing protein [Acidimicrobiales bacterium]
MNTPRSPVARAILAVLVLAGPVLAGADLVAAPVAAAGGFTASSATPGAEPTPGAVSVRDHGADGLGTEDDTAAFAAAMAAAGNGSVRYPGPTGAAQGVVYVPPGIYRLLNLTFPANLRMEVDAGAVLQQAGGRSAVSPPEYSSPGPALVFWDGPPGAPLRNVSLVGVGTATGGAKSLADPVPEGWSVEHDFMFNLDPQVTNANNLVSGLMAMNVDGFLVANVFSVQNDSRPATTPTTNADWWPGSRKAALGLRARSDSPVDRSAFYDPHNGTITNWYNVGSPRGYGPNQVNSGHNLTIDHVYSRGGTALRLETDNSNQVKFGSELRSVIATDIVGENCNRAVAFAPHFQTNHDVHVTGVRARACYQGVVEAVDKEIAPARRGAFLVSTIADVVVTGGPGAQIPIPDGTGRWKSGTSSQAFARDGLDPWAVTYGRAGLACSGRFQWPSDPIMTTEGLLQPACSVPTADPTVPGAPGIGSATIRLAQAAVSFSPAGADGCSPITCYTVTSDPGGITATGRTSPILVPNLTVGTTYVFRVHATNAVGPGTQSAPSNPVIATAPPPPAAPTGLAVTVVTRSRVELTWNRADRATSYRVSRGVVAGGPYTVIGNPIKRRIVDRWLTPGTTYFYIVQAVSSSGSSPPSSELATTTLP